MQLGAIETLLNGVDEVERFLKAKRLGLEGIEAVPGRNDLRDPERQRLARLKQVRQISGLAIPSLLLVHLNNGGLASDDPSVVEAARQDIRVAIDWAGELGAGVILLPFFSAGEITSEVSFEQVVEGLRQLCPLAAQHNVKLCYEGTLPAADIRRMAAEIGSPAFGCYFDLANVVWQGMDTATEIRALDGLIEQVHMKETRVEPGDVRPGLGRVDYAESARALQESGYDGWIVLETPGGLPEMVARDISFTRKIFPSLKAATSWPQIGTFSYGFKRGEWDRLIATCKQYGLTAVQIAAELLDEAVADPEIIPAIRAKLEANGITVAALASYRNLVVPDTAKRNINLTFLKRCLEIAPLFGTAVVATETGTRDSESDWKASPENKSKQAWETFYDALDDLLPVAEQHGSILALEGYVNNVLQNSGQLAGVLDRYRTKHLGVVLDPYNYLSRHLIPARERVTLDFLQRFEHRFVLAHMKDVSAEGAEVDTPEMGSGVFPQKLYLQFLKTHRPDLPVILEHLPLDHIPAAVSRIRAIAGELDEEERAGNSMPFYKKADRQINEEKD